MSLQIDVDFRSLIIPKWHKLVLKILNHEYTHYKFVSGRGSTKSSFVSLMVILLILMDKDYNALILRKYGTTIGDSVYNQIAWAIDQLDLNAYFKTTKHPYAFIYKKTGQRILFSGLDDPLKLKSIKAPNGYFAITVFEEMDQFCGRAEIQNVLISTQRGGHKFWNFELFNPPMEQNHWTNMEVVNPKPSTIVIKNSYLDVPEEWLGPAFIDEATYQRDNNPKYYANVYLGIPTGSGGMVFDNLEIREIDDDEINYIFDQIIQGIDWGWYPDPYHWVKCHYYPADKHLYIFDEYRTYKTSNYDTARYLMDVKKVKEEDSLIADSAEMKSVGDYRDFGLGCRGAVKGPGSVAASMKWLQSLKTITIDPTRCPETAKEFFGYQYEKDKKGEIINAYPDKDNHAIDAVRYATNLQWTRRGT